MSANRWARPARPREVTASRDRNWLISARVMDTDRPPMLDAYLTDTSAGNQADEAGDTPRRPPLAPLSPPLGGRVT
jgi:hypothetical protein